MRAEIHARSSEAAARVRVPWGRHFREKQPGSASLPKTGPGSYDSSGFPPMSFVPPAESGASLDRRIARLILGPRSTTEPPPYSRDEAAADSLATLLATLGIEPSLERDGDSWYCVFRAAQAGDGVKERIASGSATTRALAICRAVLNLPLSGTGSRLRLRRASRGWIGDEDAHPRAAPGLEQTPESEERRVTVPERESLEPPRAVRGS